MAKRIGMCCVALAGIVSSAGVAGSVRAQGNFEGSITYAVTGMGPSGATIRMSRKGTKFRQEISMPGRRGGMAGTVTIYDGDTGNAMTLMPQQKKYMVMNNKKLTDQMKGASTGNPAAVDYSTMKVTKTGQHETVAGIGCDHYTFATTKTIEDTQVDICGAPGMGFFTMTGDLASSAASAMAMMKSQNPELAKLASKGFLALKMTITSKGKPMIWEATKVERGGVDDAMFQAPAGYTKFEMPGMPRRP